MPDVRPPRDSHSRFVNWSGRVTSAPTAWLEPRTEAEVVDLVTRAAASGRRIRVVGAGHSFSAVGTPDDQAMTLDALSGLVSVDLDGGVATVAGGTRIRDLSAALAQHGLTLPIVGSIQHQSISGATATGTHGSSLRHGNLASLVAGMRIVTGGGEVVDLTADDPRLVGGRVHLGALGVITQTTVRVEPEFRLKETIEQVPVAAVAGTLETVANSAEYVKVWWLPHARNAQVVRYERVDLPAGRRPSAESRRRLDERLHRSVFPRLIAFEERRPPRVSRINRGLSKFYLGRSGMVGASSLLLNTPYPAVHRETEVAVPLDRADEVFEAVVRLFDPGTVANFPVEVRFVPADEAWLSPAEGADTCQLGVYATDGVGATRLFDRLWDELGRDRTRAHWGKELDHTAEQIANLYPRLGDFRALRDELDPDRVFGGPFLTQVLGD